MALVVPFEELAGKRIVVVGIAGRVQVAIPGQVFGKKITGGDVVGPCGMGLGCGAVIGGAVNDDADAAVDARWWCCR